MKYDGFISYSHSADGQLAPAVQSGLQQLARPWYRRRALRVFRDETGLSVNPHLWDSIAEAMDQSRYFVLLASPEAAASPWVNREIEHWLATHPAETLLPVLTDGTLVWNKALGDFDPAQSTALPAALAGAYVDEPRHLDICWARDEEQLTLRHSRFRAQIATLAAPMHDMDRDDLEGEDVRQHRRAMRFAWGTALVLVTLTVIAALAGIAAIGYAGEAERSAAEANRLRGAAEELNVILDEDLRTVQSELDAARASANASAEEANQARNNAAANQVLQSQLAYAIAQCTAAGIVCELEAG